MVIISQFSQLPLMSPSQLKFLFFPWRQQNIISLYVEKNVTWLKAPFFFAAQRLRECHWFLSSMSWECLGSAVSYWYVFYQSSKAKWRYLDQDNKYYSTDIYSTVNLQIFPFCFRQNNQDILFSMEVLFHLSKQVQ